MDVAGEVVSVVLPVCVVASTEEGGPLVVDIVDVWVVVGTGEDSALVRSVFVPVADEVLLSA